MTDLEKITMYGYDAVALEHCMKLDPSLVRKMFRIGQGDGFSIGTAPGRIISIYETQTLVNAISSKVFSYDNNAVYERNAKVMGLSISYDLSYALREPSEYRYKNPLYNTDQVEVLGWDEETYFQQSLIHDFDWIMANIYQSVFFAEQPRSINIKVALFERLHEVIEKKGAWPEIREKYRVRNEHRRVLTDDY